MPSLLQYRDMSSLDSSHVNSKKRFFKGLLAGIVFGVTHYSFLNVHTVLSGMVVVNQQGSLVQQQQQPTSTSRLLDGDRVLILNNKTVSAAAADNAPNAPSNKQQRPVLPQLHDTNKSSSLLLKPQANSKTHSDASNVPVPRMDPLQKSTESSTTLNHHPPTQQDSGKKELDASKPRRIAFVHVGKTGGSAIELALPQLRAKCFVLKEPAERQQCYQSQARANSPLTQLVDQDMHLNIRKQNDLTDTNHTSFLWTMRNPISRVISSFKFLHHNNTKSTYARESWKEKEHFYRECFPTVHHFITSLEDAMNLMTNKRHKNSNNTTQPQQLTACQIQAIQVVRGDQTPATRLANFHLYCNYGYYYKHSMLKYPRIQENFVVRMDHLWHDLKKLDVSLGGAGKFSGEGKVLQHDGSAVKEEKKKDTIENKKYSGEHLTPAQRKAFCCLLTQELQLYQYIIQRANNLLTEEKESTVQDLLHTCPLAATHWTKGTDTTPSFIDWQAWNANNCPTFDPPSPTKPIVVPTIGHN